MNKQHLLSLINFSGLNEVNKQELTKMVEAAPMIDKGFIKQLRNRLAEIADALAENIANLQIQSATDEFQTEMHSIQQDVDKLNSAIAKKADEIDLQTVRSKIT